MQAVMLMNSSNDSMFAASKYLLFEEHDFRLHELLFSIFFEFEQLVYLDYYFQVELYDLPVHDHQAMCRS